MSNIIDIEDLRKAFNEKMSTEQWMSFAEKQTDIIESYQSKIKDLQQKCTHLENLLMNQYAKPLSSEEVICLQQIEKLSEVSAARQLTLEEVKRLDLLVKNLKLIREESTIIVNNKRSDSLKEADLVAIAKSSTADSEDNA